MDKTNPVPINSKTNYLTNAREVAVCGVKGKILSLIVNMTMEYIAFQSVVIRGDFILPRSLLVFSEAL